MQNPRFASIKEFQRRYYLFDPEKYGRIFAFIDFANVRKWSEYLGCEVDIEKVMNICKSVNCKRSFFYYGFYKDNQGSIYRIDKARKCGFVVRTKEVKLINEIDESGRLIRQIPKCNFDVEITMDMITKILKYDSVFLFSGDSDFGKLLQYIRNKSKKAVIICIREYMSSELQKNCDKYIPANPLRHLLKLEQQK